jgi:hypothetical protein
MHRATVPVDKHLVEAGQAKLDHLWHKDMDGGELECEWAEHLGYIIILTHRIIGPILVQNTNLNTFTT